MKIVTHVCIIGCIIIDTIDQLKQHEYLNTLYFLHETQTLL